MKYNSNAARINDYGYSIAEVANENDPFTMLQPGHSSSAGYINLLSNRHCPCEQCYDSSLDIIEEECNSCSYIDVCDSDAGCLLTEAHMYYGSIELVIKMIERPFCAYGISDYRSIPAIVPHVSSMEWATERHRCRYNLLNIEFSIPETSYFQLVSKIYSIPYIGAFALYPKYTDFQKDSHWILLVPLDGCISFHQWCTLTEWLCNELNITNNLDPHMPSPCPAENLFSTLQYKKVAISESESPLFPALQVLGAIVEATNTHWFEELGTIDPVGHFNCYYDWNKLLNSLGFYPIDDSNWCLPDSSELKPSVRVVDNKLYDIDSDNNVIVSTAKSQFEVFLEWNRSITLREAFELANIQTVNGTGMTIPEYNRSLVGLFTPEHDISNSFPIKSGSQGWDEAVQWIVENQFQSNSLNMIYGLSGSFKSFHASDLAACVATGTPWGSSHVTKGNVLYIAAEGDTGLSKRIKAWELTHKQETHNLFRIGQPIALTEANSFNQLLKVIDSICLEHGDIVMVVIDTLARCFGNGDENSTKDMGAFISACDHLKQRTQAAILLIHHTGKTTTRGARGNSSLKAALDTEFRVDRKQNNLSYSLVCTKQKDSEPLPTQVIKLVNVKLSDDNESSSLCRSFNPVKESDSVKSSQLSNDVKDVISLMTSCGGTCSRERLKELLSNQQTKKISDNNLRTRLTRVIQKLEKENVISVDKKRKEITLTKK